MAGFFNMRGVQLPFGMSNASNPNVSPTNNNQQPPNQQQQTSRQQLNQQPQNPGADPRNVNANANNNNDPTQNTDPNNNADPSKGPGSQLDNFKDIFKLQVDAQGNPIAPSDPLAKPITQFDAKKFGEATKNMNFAGGISQEQLTKAMSGQDPAAFLDVLNTVARNGFQAAMHLNVNALETGFTNFKQNFDEALPSRVRNLQISQAAPKHPALQHSAVAPVIEALKMSIGQANPNLHPSQVADIAENYLIAMNKDMQTADTQQQQQLQTRNQPKPVNWLDYMSKEDQPSGNGN